MLITAFKNNLGKSSHGGQSLYDHLMDCTRIAHNVLTDTRFAPYNYPKAKRDQLLFSVFVHDLGKLDDRFQAMLVAARDGRPLPSKRVKHEASSLDFEPLLRENVDEICAHLEQMLGALLSNAVKFSERGCVRLVVTGIEAREKAAMICPE